ncbi:MAG: phosphatase PAP2 family protein [Clostridia bacterium]|nr:phosphatase PAP2 family protein [Clostridia bacterium]
MSLRRWFSNSDRYLLYCVNQRLKCAALDLLMPWFTRLGGVTFAFTVIVAATIFGREPTRHAGLQAMIALASSHLTVRICKNWVGRCRPYLSLPDIRYLCQPWRDCSFPSGHTAASFSLAVVLALNFPFLTWPLVAAAGLTGISRMYVGMHYPSDVLGGATLGTVFAYLAHWCF